MVKGREVSARGDVLGPEFEVDPQGGQYAPADPVLKRIVAEQRQMARTAARRDAGTDRFVEAALGLLRQFVKVGRVRGFKRGLTAAARAGQAAHAVHDEHDNFGVGLFGDEFDER